jgi:uncharacterized protein YjbI with pentapeptide repeats
VLAKTSSAFLFRLHRAEMTTFTYTSVRSVAKCSRRGAHVVPCATSKLGRAGCELAAVGAAIILTAMPACAELNKFEYSAGGEFGMGTAQQYGEADVKDRDFSGQDLRRANFTSADCRYE